MEDENEIKKVPEYTMDIDANEIYIVTCQLLKDIKIMNTEKLKEKYAAFEKKFPKLYNFCLTEVDESQVKSVLSKMLNTRENVKRGNISTFNANVEIGEYAANKFIYPITGEPTKRQKSEALHKIIKGEEQKKSSNT
jgi:hypothetical protein